MQLFPTSEYIAMFIIIEIVNFVSPRN